MSLFIDDGYTRTRHLDAIPGLYPAVVVVYRPALALKRNEHQLAATQGSAEKVTNLESELLARHVITLNEERLTREQAARLVPDLRNKMLNLVLGYMPADEEADAKNSPSGCE